MFCHLGSSVLADLRGPRRMELRNLVRRAHVRTIVTAWVTTVPASALLAIGAFHLIGLVF